MISHRDRMRLMEAYRREPCVGTAAMIKCVGGLLIVAALAILGAVSDDSSGNDAGAQQAKKKENAPATLRTTHYEAQGRVEPARRAPTAQMPSVTAAVRP
jgi:hypothetical protein